MNPIDRDIADAFAALDRAVGDDPVGDLAAKVLVRLDEPEESEQEPPAAAAPTPTAPPPPDDTGRQDIIELATSARRRISERESSEADGDDSAVLLTAAHGGLRAVALPDPSKGRVPPRGGATIRPQTAGDDRRADARSNAPFWILGAVATLAAAAAVAVFGNGRPPHPSAVGDAARQVAQADTAEARPAPPPPAAAPEAAPARASEPTPREPEPPPPAQAQPPPEPVAQATPEPRPSRNRPSRSTPSSRAAEPPKAADETPSAPTVAAVPDPSAPSTEPGVAPGGGNVSLEDMLDDASGRKKAPSAEEREKQRREREAAEDRKALDRRDVSRTLDGVRGEIQRCAEVEGARGKVTIKFVIAPSGEVKSSAATGDHAGSRTGSCVAAAVKQAKFPAFDGIPVSVTYPFVLEAP